MLAQNHWYQILFPSFLTNRVLLKTIFQLMIIIFVIFKSCFRFNYRATHYMVNHGFYNFLNWFDERAWYPLGRIVGGTVSCLSFCLNLCSVTNIMSSMCIGALTQRHIFHWCRGHSSASTCLQYFLLESLRC